MNVIRIETKSDKIPSGICWVTLDQNSGIESGTIVPEGSTVYVYVSTGLKETEPPTTAETEPEPPQLETDPAPAPGD